ncbi:head-tail joining protein [Xanthobacter autotrophicus]|uniref:head-tail joining protein n=1 Tax=Xanthobacter autotrophicus TaxID=280 RepID=UPI0037291E6F
MDAYSAGVDLYFEDPHLGRSALYRAGGVGSGLTVTVVETRSDAEASYGQARVVAETGVFDLRVSEVSAPAEGDTLTFKGRTYVVTGAPVMNAARDVWTLTTRPS